MNILEIKTRPNAELNSKFNHIRFR